MFFEKSTDLVQIIAPSSPSDLPEYTVIISKITEYFNDQNINFTYNIDFNDNSILHYYANTPQFRATDLMQALTEPRVKIIWALRGGSSAAELIDYLDFNTRLTQPKILIGFSDITTLHLLFNQHYNLPTIHGCTIRSIARHNKPHIIAEYINIINLNKHLTYNLKPLNYFEKSLKITGLLRGGNLKVITTLIGTKLHPQFDDALLIIEDVEEHPYAIMRDLVHLSQAGLLAKVQAIIFGDFLLAGKHSDLIDQTIDYFAKTTQLPCYRIANFGHSANNDPVILGTSCIIIDNILSIDNPFNDKFLAKYI